MQIEERDDLVIALVERTEVEGRPPLAALGDRAGEVDVVRLVDSADLDDATVERLGFVARPQWINWVARVGASPEEYLHGLTGQERRNVRLAQRFVRDQGVRIEVREGLSEAFLDQFLDLYDGQIARMPRGRNFARRWRDRLLAARAELVSVGAYHGAALVAGALWWVREAESLLQMRFSTASVDSRAGRVLRALYATALDCARQRGLRYASLGNDPALYGHVVQPGLHTFKSRFGFRPIPAEVVDPRLWGEFADHFVSLRRLADPSVLVSWGPHRGTPLSWPDAAWSVELGRYLLTSGGDPDGGGAADGIPAGGVPADGSGVRGGPDDRPGPGVGLGHLSSAKRLLVP